VLLVTHDLGVVAQTCSRVAVMYGGRIVEEGSTEQIFESPRHPYTVGLLGSIPRVDGALSERLPSVPGSPPDLANPQPGCAFYPRCPLANDECRGGVIPLIQVGAGHRAACLRHELVNRESVTFGALHAAG
jgi:oligopeptide/dipeptide ABC transporter ATP-binding protein